MRKHFWLIALGLSLVFMSAGIYLVHYLVFSDAHHIYIYLVGDLAFLPVEVLVVTLIIDQMLGIREKHAVMEKMNMVIGAFFSELGTPLLAELLPAMCGAAEIRERLHLKASWKKDDFSGAFQFARTLDCRVDLSLIDLDALKSHLLRQRHFILRLLENPNLLEHERFTDLLWAVHHLEEELEARTNVLELTPADEAHLEVDARRAFNALLAEWVVYAQHLKSDYPYLFSLVVRTHPFQDSPSAIITQ